jgi:UDP-GlcNAc:undecaprenyl-phosphate GlcNAc-1-phosphate transferase
MGILIGGLLATSLGVLDDRTNIPPIPKLFFQFAIASIAFVMGLKIRLLTNPFGPDFELGLLSYPVTLLWFLGIMNAFNLIDGIDGVAAGIAVITGVVLVVWSILFRNPAMIVLALVMIGGCLAFLRYNFHPARVFMGDAGSLFLGFLIAATPMVSMGQVKGVTAMTLLVPIMVLFIPIFDTSTAIIRRIGQHAPLMTGDRLHLHHRLLSIGFSQKGTALVIYFVTAMFGLIAIGFSFTTRRTMFILLILLAFLMAAICIALFRLAEQIHRNGSQNNDPRERQ